MTKPIARQNILFALRLITKMSVPGLFGDLTLHFRDGKLGDLQKIKDMELEGQGYSQSIVFQKRDEEEEIQQLLEALFSDYEGR